jgi:hypothetical protein
MTADKKALSSIIFFTQLKEAVLRISVIIHQIPTGKTKKEKR